MSHLQHCVVFGFSPRPIAIEPVVGEYRKYRVEKLTSHTRFVALDMVHCTIALITPGANYHYFGKQFELPVMTQNPHVSRSGQVVIGGDAREMVSIVDAASDTVQQDHDYQSLKRLRVAERRAFRMLTIAQTVQVDPYASVANFLPELLVECADPLSIADDSWCSPQLQTLARYSLGTISKYRKFYIKAQFSGELTVEPCLNQDHLLRMKIGDNEQLVPVSSVLLDGIVEGTYVKAGQPIADVCKRFEYPNWQAVEDELGVNTLYLLRGILDDAAITPKKHKLNGYGNLYNSLLFDVETLNGNFRHVLDLAPVHGYTRPHNDDGYLLLPPVELPEDMTLPPVNGILYRLAPPRPLAVSPKKRRYRNESRSDIAIALQEAGIKASR